MDNSKLLKLLRDSNMALHYPDYRRCVQTKIALLHNVVSKTWLHFIILLL